MNFLLFVLSVITACYARDLRTDRWEITDFVWNAGLIALSDKGSEPSPVQFFEHEDSLTFNPALYKNIQRGDIVWLKCRFVASFCDQILPKTKHPFVLIISDGDESFPSQCGLTEERFRAFLLDDRIIHIFAQNCDIQEPLAKVSLLPIGLDFHTIAYKGVRGGGEKWGLLWNKNSN